jgi:hypothetical protein
MPSYTDLGLSNPTVARLQAQFGTLDLNRLQIQRKQFYSYVTYPKAGTSQLNFFGQAVGNNNSTLDDTNIPVQGSFGTSHFLIKGIECKWKLKTYNPTAYIGTDATTITSDLLGGLFGAGVFELVVNAKTYIQVNKPFLQIPPADGRVSYWTAGNYSANIAAEPNVELNSRSESRYLCDPEIFILSQQNFSAQINFPSGACAVRASSVVDDSTNPLKVGVVLDGYEFRPVQ